MNSQPPLVELALSRENLTSLLVIGEPLWNLTPLRSVKVQVSLSALWVHLVASHGSTERPSLLPIVSVSYIWTYTQIEALLNTIVLFMSTESWARAITRSPPDFCGPVAVLAPPDADGALAPLFGEEEPPPLLVPHAASSAVRPTPPIPSAPNRRAFRRVISCARMASWRAAAGSSGWGRRIVGAPRGLVRSR